MVRSRTSPLSGAFFGSALCPLAALSRWGHRGCGSMALCARAHRLLESTCSVQHSRADIEWPRPAQTCSLWVPTRVGLCGAGPHLLGLHPLRGSLGPRLGGGGSILRQGGRVRSAAAPSGACHTLLPARGPKKPHWPLPAALTPSPSPPAQPWTTSFGAPAGHCARVAVTGGRHCRHLASGAACLCGRPSPAAASRAAEPRAPPFGPCSPSQAAVVAAGLGLPPSQRQQQQQQSKRMPL